MIKKKIPAYKQHERMGEGDPMRMAGLDVSKPKLRLKKPKTKLKRKRNKKEVPFEDGTGFDFRHTQ